MLRWSPQHSGSMRSCYKVTESARWPMHSRGSASAGHVRTQPPCSCAGAKYESCIQDSIARTYFTRLVLGTNYLRTWCHSDASRAAQQAGLTAPFGKSLCKRDAQKAEQLLAEPAHRTRQACTQVRDTRQFLYERFFLVCLGVTRGVEQFVLQVGLYAEEYLVYIPAASWLRAFPTPQPLVSSTCCANAVDVNPAHTANGSESRPAPPAGGGLRAARTLTRACAGSRILL